MTSVAGTKRAQTDETVVAETAYGYRLRSVNAVGTSDWSSIASVTTPPPAPGELAIAGNTTTRVELTWRDLSSTENGYRIDRAVNGGAFELLSAIDANNTNFVDHSVGPTTLYAYRVVTLAPSGETAATIEVTTPARPLSPASLTATSSLASKVQLSWADPQAGVTRYEIERKVGDGSFALLAMPAGEARSYDDTSVVSETAYVFRIRAISDVGTSEWSTESSVITPPPAPLIGEVSIGAGGSNEDCSAIYRSGRTSSGLYMIDPDGPGGEDPFQTYCDMTNGAFTLINDQDTNVAGGYLPVSTWLAGVSTTAPNAGQWGVLQKIP